MISPELLRRHTCFSGADEDSLRAIAMVSDELRVNPGQTLFEEGTPAEHLYIVTEGEIDIQYVLNSGEVQIVDTRVVGDLMAWSALVPPYRCTAAGVARCPSRVLLIDAHTLRERCEADRELGYRLMREIAKVASFRLQGARVQLATKA